jgi:transposase
VAPVGPRKPPNEREARMTSMGAEEMTKTTIGVDVSRDHLDAHRWPDGAARRFSSNPSGYRALIGWLGGLEIARIVFEPTGS